MKSIFLSLSLLLLFACNSGETPPAINTADTPAPTEATEAEPEASGPTSITQPCNKISDHLVTTTFGWKGSTDGVPTTMQNGMLNACQFTSTSNEGSVTAAISYSTERTIEGKYLERSFQNDLANQDEAMTCSALDIGLGDEAIYSHGRRGPNYVYKLRWRNGNKVDYSLTYRSPRLLNQEVILEHLKVLSSKL